MVSEYKQHKKQRSVLCNMKYAIRGDTLTVWLSGELDHHCAERIRIGLETLLENARIKHLTLNLKDLSFMDSSGIGVVLGRYNTLVKRGGDVTVEQPSARVDRIFSMSGIYQIINKR